VTVECEQIDVLLYFSHREEVAGDIEHCSAPRKARLIHDRERGYRPPCPRRSHLHVDIEWQKLSQRLHAPEQSGRTVGDQSHRIGRRGQLVTLFAQRRAIRGEAQLNLGRRRISR